MAEGGCFKSLLAGIGCLTVVAVGGIAAWHYRAQLGGLYRSIVEREPPASFPQPGADTVPSTGRPSAQAFESARRTQDAMARRDGPGYVTCRPMRWRRSSPADSARRGDILSTRGRMTRGRERRSPLSVVRHPYQSTDNGERRTDNAFPVDRAIGYDGT